MREYKLGHSGMKFLLIHGWLWSLINYIELFKVNLDATTFSMVGTGRKFHFFILYIVILSTILPVPTV